MSEEQTGSNNMMRLVLFVVVAIGIIFAIKFIFGIALTIIKWAAIAVVGVALTSWIFGRKKDKNSG
jgi:predicted exporter